MFKYCNLYSGSSGNCSYIESDNTKLLIDCGVSSKKLEGALNSIGLSLQEIDGILISHEHNDHVKGLSAVCKKYHIPIYANNPTFTNITQNVPDELRKKFNTNEYFEIGDVKVYPFSIPHDAADPCGFNLFFENKKFTIATDIGHIDNKVLHNLDESDFLLLESNYEITMLQCSKYPYLLKKRILGPNGHLSNDDAGLVISELLKNGVQNIMLGHLSENNNFPELAYQTVIDKIIAKNADIDKLKLQVADRYVPNKIVNI